MGIPKVLLGNTGIQVSKLCFGTLTISPLQCAFSIDKGADLLRFAIDQGITFFDTAEIYQTYDVLHEAVKYKQDIVISSKDYCYDRKTAEASLDRALKAIGRDYIDIFMLHEQESVHTIRGHWEAVEYLLERKTKGDVRAVGLSTHHIAAVKASMDYPDLEIIHPIYNRQGLGVVDGSAADMLQAIRAASDRGKGIFGMKPLGGGHLIPTAKEEIQYVNSLPCIDAIAVGMKSREEILYNAALFAGDPVEDEVEEKLRKQKRNIMVHDWCEGCAACAKACDQSAIKIENGKAVIDRDKCVLCAYCAKACPMFCIKVV